MLGHPQSDTPVLPMESTSPSNICSSSLILIPLCYPWKAQTLQTSALAASFCTPIIPMKSITPQSTFCGGRLETDSCSAPALYCDVKTLCAAQIHVLPFHCRQLDADTCHAPCLIQESCIFGACMLVYCMLVHSLPVVLHVGAFIACMMAPFIACHTAACWWLLIAPDCFLSGQCFMHDA
eukprot:scaffold87659_cov19-Tisochrysis_lutea.AAC.1